MSILSAYQPHQPRGLLTLLTTHLVYTTLPYYVPYPTLPIGMSRPYVTLLWDPMVLIFVNYVDGQNVCFVGSWFFGGGGLVGENSFGGWEQLQQIFTCPQMTSNVLWNGPIPPKNVVRLARQAAIMLGGNGFFQGMFQNIMGFLTF